MSLMGLSGKERMSQNKLYRKLKKRPMELFSQMKLKKKKTTLWAKKRKKSILWMLLWRDINKEAVQQDY